VVDFSQRGIQFFHGGIGIGHRLIQIVSDLGIIKLFGDTLECVMVEAILSGFLLMPR
jgi:hypothetical protein